MNTLTIFLFVMALTLFVASVFVYRAASARLRAARIIESDEQYLLRRIGWAAADYVTVDGAGLLRAVCTLKKLGKTYAELLHKRRTSSLEAREGNVG